MSPIWEAISKLCIFEERLGKTKMCGNVCIFNNNKLLLRMQTLLKLPNGGQDTQKFSPKTHSFLYNAMAPGDMGYLGISVVGCANKPRLLDPNKPL